MTESRRLPTVSVLQATQASAQLAPLAQRALQSAQQLRWILPLLPPSLRAGVRPGPLEGAQWCVVVDNAAIAAKLRQLLPVLQSQLRTKGCEVTAIRIKIQTAVPAD